MRFDLPVSDSVKSQVSPYYYMVVNMFIACLLTCKHG